MKLLICPNGQDFIDRFKPALLAHEVVYQLLMGKALANAETPYAPGCFFGAVLDDADRPVLLFGHKAPFRMHVHSLDTAAIEASVPLLVSYINENQIEIAGVLCSEAIGSVYAACDPEHTYQRAIGMDIMELREVNAIPLASGHFRVATEADLDLICRWHMEFNAEAAGHTMEYAEAYEQNSKRVSDFYLLEDPTGQIVAMACVVRKLLQGCCLSLVYTDPAQRGKGYCATLMHHLAKLQLETTDYQYLGLFVDKANPISNHTYKKVGYVILEDSIEYDRKAK